MIADSVHVYSSVATYFICVVGEGVEGFEAVVPPHVVGEAGAVEMVLLA